MIGRKEAIGLAVVVAALVVGGSALGSQLLSGADGYTGCLTQRGDLVKFAEGASPLKPCASGQVQVQFEGDLGSVVAGSGLVGQTENGIVTLSIHSSYALPQGCEARSYATWDGSAWVCSVARDPDPAPLP